MNASVNMSQKFKSLYRSTCPILPCPTYQTTDYNDSRDGKRRAKGSIACKYKVVRLRSRAVVGKR